MSQLPHSTARTTTENIFSEISTIIADSKEAATTATRTPKRPASDELQGQAKKVMTNPFSSVESAARFNPMALDQPKFVSAARMVGNIHTNVQAMPEISDQELLEMALEFEKKYPQ